jgi:hypothetical protein
MSAASGSAPSTKTHTMKKTHKTTTKAANDTANMPGAVSGSDAKGGK